MTLEEKSKIYQLKKEGYLWAVIDRCTQIMVVNQVMLLSNESGVFFR